MPTPDANDDPIEWTLVDSDLTTVLAVLPAATNSNLYLELNEPGSGNVSVPLLSTSAALIESGQFIRAKYRGALRGGFFVENISRSQVNQGEGGELWTSVSGRGALSILDRAKVWTDGTAETTRTFEAMTKADILITLITEAQARGTLSELTYDFTDTDDSDSTAWTDSETMQFSVGKSYLDVVREMAELGIDFNITVEIDGTFNLSAYSTAYGTDKSETIYFRRGSNCVEVSNSEMGAEIANALLIKYDGGYSYTSDSTSITNRGRREAIVDAIDAFNSDHALTYGSARLTYLKNPKTEQDVKVYDGIGTRVFIDYDLGDYITLDLSGVETSNRVRSLQLSWDMTEKADVIVGLNSTVFENEIRQSNDIRKLFEMWRRAHDGDKLQVSFWAAIGQLSSLATTGTAVYAMAVSATGVLYVGGVITKVAGKTIGNAAAYDTNTGIWSTLGTGFNGPVYAIACNGNEIFFGGDFTDADGTTVGYVCKYSESGGTFSTMDSGVNNVVRAITIDTANDIVYVGGSLTSLGAGATASEAIGAWNDGAGTWGAMDGLSNGSAVVNTVRSISLSGTKVFIAAENVESPSVGVAYWDTGTSDWHAMGTGFSGSGQGYSSAVLGDYVYFGGNFTDANSVANTANLARWNITGAAFESIDGGGANGNVLAMTVVNETDLVIGGAFTTVGAGALAAAKIARWNNGIWTLLDTGLNNTCYALTSYNGNIGAGGTFTTAGGKPIKFVGAYLTNLPELVDYLETGSGSSASSYTHPNHSGDVTSVGDGATTIANDAVTNAKMANMAEGTVKAKITSGTGDPEDTNLADFATEIQPLVLAGQTGDRVVISDSSGAITTDSNLSFAAMTDQLTLGVASPVTSNGGFMQAYESVSVGHYLTTWGTSVASFIRGILARGTAASPTAVQAEDVEFRIRASAHNGTTYPGSNLEVRFIANENQAVGSHGSRIEFYTTPDGSTTLTKVMTLQDDGNVNIESGKSYLVNGSPISGGASTQSNQRSWFLC